ncbi:hypothetical protein MICRO8M_70368 [Microbacterium sp. 8M]|nr:hypothetical protein MICRO8M_70368 [Microbacterium sp. 8M]
MVLQRERRLRQGREQRPVRLELGSAVLRDHQGLTAPYDHTREAVTTTSPPRGLSKQCRARRTRGTMLSARRRSRTDRDGHPGRLLIWREGEWSVTSSNASCR